MQEIEDEATAKGYHGYVNDDADYTVAGVTKAARNAAKKTGEK